MLKCVFLFRELTSLNSIYSIVFICWLVKLLNLCWKIMTCSPGLKRLIISHPGKRGPLSRPLRSIVALRVINSLSKWQFRVLLMHPTHLFSSKDLLMDHMLTMKTYFFNAISTKKQKLARVANRTNPIRQAKIRNFEHYR